MINVTITKNNGEIKIIRNINAIFTKDKNTNDMIQISPENLNTQFLHQFIEFRTLDSITYNIDLGSVNHLHWEYES